MFQRVTLPNMKTITKLLLSAVLFSGSLFSCKHQSALMMTADPIDTVRVGFIGVGMRGSGAVNRFTYLDGVKIVAICDLEQSNIDKAQKKITDRGLPAAAEYVGEDSWKQLCLRDDIDLVYICTDWISHTPMAVYAMEHGKHTAVEVPAAMSIKECWQLVNTCEKTRHHCMMLENCVYDFFEMTALNMAQHGLFGEIVHAEGGYIHNLDPYWELYHNNWRLEYNRTHRGDNYPTHGIGPLCQVLNIHRGDRMEYVISMDSKAVHGAKIAKELMGAEEFADGDHTVSLIRTACGRIIEIQHNVYASRPYSRLYQLTGTDGFAAKYPRKGFSLKTENLTGEMFADGQYDKLDGESFVSDEIYDALIEKYKPEFLGEIEQKAREVGGHGGMDFIMDYRLIYCLHNGLPLDQDVYDAAEWCCLTELSRKSIEAGSKPVRVPDFTRGRWKEIKGYSYASK